MDRDERASDGIRLSDEGGPDAAVEVVVAWGTGPSRTTLGVYRVGKGQRFVVGEADGCHAIVPASVLGSDRVELVTFDENGAWVTRPAPASAAIDGELVRDDLLPLARNQRVRLLLEGFSFRITLLAEMRAPRPSLLAALRSRTSSSISFSFFVHGALFAACAWLMPTLSEGDAEAMGRDRILTMQKFLDAAAEREREAIPQPSSGESEAAAAPSDSGGGRARGPGGSMGTTTPVPSKGHWAIKGDARPQDAAFAHASDRELAKSFGLLGFLNSSEMENVPKAPWETVAIGSDPLSHYGNFWDNALGDASGTGLGLTGTGEGGDGVNDGVGINDVGGLARSLSLRNGAAPPGGFGGCKGGPCTAGLGPHKPVEPRLRFAKDVQVNGHIPPEVIQRIVRQNMGRFRACYESGLRTNPTLGGRVVVRFVIDRQGSVAVATDGGSDLPDTATTACIVRTFQTLSFPEPQGGTVQVTYPLVLSNE
jgi:hypothetical protein